MNKLSAEHIAQIRARLDAATPGPWVYRIDGERPDWRLILSIPHPIDVAQIPPWGGGIGEDDATFIAATPTDIAALLAHVAALDAELAEVRDENAELCKVAEAGDKLADAAEDIVLDISRYSIKPSDEPFSVKAAQIVTLKAAYEKFDRVLNGEDAANE